VSIYIPRPFAPREADQVARLIAEHPFATLITSSAAEAQVSHLPLQFVAGDGSQSVLLGHMARANPHWQHFGDGPSVAIFHGPHAYVSPSWYEDPVTAVPTWNYCVAHLHGPAEVMDAEGEKQTLLEEMIERYESARERPWRLRLEGRPLEAMLQAIVGFRLRVQRIDAKFKLSQNRSADDRQRVIAGLRAEGRAEADATAAWMDAYARES
jgi:transcriptional regulator